MMILITVFHRVLRILLSCIDGVKASRDSVNCMGCMRAVHSCMRVASTFVNKAHMWLLLRGRVATGCKSAEGTGAAA